MSRKNVELVRQLNDALARGSGAAWYRFTSVDRTQVARIESTSPREEEDGA
jgi:hypothetical protein